MGTLNSRAHFSRERARHGGGLRPVFSDCELGHEKPDYKTSALCKQVRRITSMVLSGECADPALQSLVVEDVLPAPNAGRLLIRVFARSGPATLVELHQRLASVQGLLRTRIAESIARKRAPELAFDVLLMATPPGEAHSGENEPGEVPHG